MANHQPTLFEADRMGLGDSISLTMASLQAYGATHDHWAIAYSGGKDSTTVVTLVCHLIKTGRVVPPRRLTVLYADTRMELPPLAAAANELMSQLRAEGIDARTVLAPMDLRFFVYMLGRGVPPPNNNTFRWCTRQIKVDPMAAELRRLVVEEAGGNKVLMLTGVRLGESAARDQRIALSCGRDNSECGQGWFQESLPGALCDTLAPILHWRTCLVWDWLLGAVPKPLQHGYPTRAVAEAYGLDAEGSQGEIHARTGCNGCPLANVDSALDNLLRHGTKWAYLEPLKELRPLYRWLREPAQRLRQPAGERRQDGTRSGNQCRMGPLTIEARLAALAKVVEIQDRCNAARLSQPVVDMLNGEEHTRIMELIGANTWPRKWTGTEPRADLPYEDCTASGESQGLLECLFEGET